MAPSFFQSVFNQPSRSYSSNTTAATASSAKQPPAAAVTPVAVSPSRSASYYSSAADPRIRREWEQILSQANNNKPRRTRSEMMTPPRRRNTTTTASEDSYARRAVPITSPPVRGSSTLLTAPATRPPGAAKFSVGQESNESDDDNANSDVFFTPKSTPEGSPRDSDAKIHHALSRAATIAAPPSPSPSPPPPPSRPPPPPSSASVSSNSSDRYTNYSWSAGEGSDLTSLPSSSSHSQHSSPKDATNTTMYSIARSQSARSSGSTASTSSLPSEDWSKDVRWLVPPNTDQRRVVGRTRSAPGSRASKRRPRMKKRMSAVIEVDESDEGMMTSQSLASPRLRMLSAEGSMNRRSRSLRSSSPSSIARTVTLPTPLPVSNGVPTSSSGYTSLVLPRAQYRPSKHPDRVSSQIDITRSGLAQSTMATISVSKHAATAVAHHRTRKISLPAIWKSSEAATPSHLLNDYPSPVSFATHTPPPSRLHSNEVLVQVWAVAVDRLDVLLVKEKSAKADGYGFIPGRSFVGRVCESGWEVSNVARGDWVFGLLDLPKSGALSEFIIVDRRRLTVAPTPTHDLTLDQIATLPLSAVPAHRAVRTLSAISNQTRALVLNAHDGPGVLAAQRLCSLGARVVAQIPHDDDVDDLGHSTKERLATFGVIDVRLGSVSDVVSKFQDGSFDIVIDNAGGRPVWDACRRLLGSAGQFTTVIGDALDSAISRGAHVRSSLRSLRSAFVKTDHKAIGYDWVSPATDIDNEGEDIRDSLAAVARLVRDNVIVPWVTRIIPFERAPELLNVHPHSDSATGAGSGNKLVSEGQTAVVRVIG